MATIPAPTLDPTDAPSSTDRQRRHVFRYLRALGASPVEADDLSQETMLAWLQQRPEPADAAAFLRGVARNQWLRTRRWWHRRREREVAAAVDELWLATAEHDGGDELIERLRRCLEQLQPRARTALERHYRDGTPWPAVASELAMKPNGVKTLAQRSREALRACIERNPT